MADPLRLYGLKAVVLAGASGIGEAVSRTLVKHGAEVVALDTESSGVEAVYASVKGVTGRALSSKADDIGTAVIDASKDVLGGIDVVVAYIELPQDAPIGDNDAPARSRMVDARAAIYSSIAAATLPYLKNSPAGRFISIGFVRSVFGIDGEAAYESSRQKLAEFCQQFAADHGEHGVSANYIQPGAIMTPESRKVYSMSKDLRDYCIQRSAARRLAEPVDVAKVALFLASDDAGFVNGAGVMVDGGNSSAE